MAEAKPVDQRELRRIPTRELHADRGFALMSAAGAAAALCASTTFWIISGWPLGFAAPTMAVLYCSFFATLENPVPTLKVSLIYTLFSSPFAGLYVLLLLPSAHSFEMLMLMFAPFLLICGIFLARPTSIIRVVPLCFTTLATLTMIDIGISDMTSFINSQISQAIGIGFAVIFTAIFRSVSTEWTARRLLRAGRNEIARFAHSIKPPSIVSFTIRMVDRVSLLIPRLAAAGGVHEKKMTTESVLRDMRVGLNMTHLIRIRSRLERNAITIQPLLQELSDDFAHRPTQHSSTDPGLLEKIDHTLRSVCSSPSFPQKNVAVAALVGIRRDMFPKALPFQPSTQTIREA